jgi:hypothetical protein
MMPIRMETMIDSDTLYLPQLKPLVGKSVEIIVREMPRPAKDLENGSLVSPLKGSVIEYHEPFEPALLPNDWEAVR